MILGDVKILTVLQALLITLLLLGDYGEPEPDWLEEEREFFRKERDKDGDGKLNKVCAMFYLVV